MNKGMNKITTSFSIILICISGLVSGQIRENQNLPSLNGHTFIPVGFIQGPFTNSYFNTDLGVAQSMSLKIPITINGQTYVGETGKLVFINLGFQYQQKIKDWIAFNGIIYIKSRIGTDVRSILAQGINTVSGYKLEWTIKLIEKEKYQLSGAVLVSNASGSFIDFVGYIEDINNNNPNPSISGTVPSTNSGVGLRYAYGFSSMFGLTLSGDIRYGEALIRGNAGFTHRFGMVADMDLYPKTEVPIGMALSFVNTSIPESVLNETKSSTLGSLKIAYTGSPDFSLGLDINYQIFPVSYTEDKLKVIGAMINTRYYFN